jgi:hypothetical protein
VEVAAGARLEEPVVEAQGATLERLLLALRTQVVGVEELVTTPVQYLALVVPAS